MGFRIDKGVFQFKDGDRFINKFKIDEAGTMVEVDPESGDPVAAYMRVGDKASDADRLDGIDSGAFLRSNADDNVSAHTEWQDNKNIRLGNSADFRIWFSGSHTYFRNYNHGNGNIYFQGEDTAGSNHALLYMFTANTRPYVSLYEDGAERFRTTSAGVEVLGKLSFGAITGTWVTSNQMADSIGWNGNHGVYIGSDTLGSNSYIYGDGTFYTNGNRYDLIHSGTIGSQSVDNADKLDGSHRHEVGNRDYTRTTFYVDGEAEIYYPVLITPRGGYSFNRWSISRRYNWTAPWDPIGTGSHKGGLTFDFYWAGDTAWGGNDKSIRIHQFSEQYTTMVGGIALARTGGMIVWLRGGHARYDLQVDTAQTSVSVKLDGWTDGSGTRFDPTGDVNQHRNSIWNNYPVRNGDDLYINNNAVATQSWVDGAFLRTGEKAADANLLDGINSSQFLRSDANDTKSGDTTFTGKVTLQTNLVITEDAPTISLLDTSSGADDFYIHVNSNNFYVLRDTAGSNNVDGGWDSPHPLQLEGDTNKALIFGNQIKSAAYQNTSAFDAAGTGAAEAGAVNQRIDDEVMPQITEAQNAAAAAQTTADSKLGATAKAADSDKLDGYDWMQSGKNVRANEFYADNWFRNYNSGEGIYNQATAVHWYSDSTARWRHRSGSSSESWILMCTSNNAARGSFYANSSNQVGILDADNHWAVRVVHDSYVEFRDNNEVTFRVGQGGVSGNYGTVQTHGNGKGGYEGYSINGRFVWMSQDSGFCGIYNDTDNEWMTIWRRNGSTELHHNGSKKLETTSSGATVTGTMTATSFSGSGANLTNLPIPDQRTPATVNGEPAGVIVSVNFNLDRGVIEFTLETGEVINGALAR